MTSRRSFAHLTGWLQKKVLRPLGIQSMHQTHCWEERAWLQLSWRQTLGPEWKKRKKLSCFWYRQILQQTLYWKATRKERGNVREGERDGRKGFLLSWWCWNFLPWQETGTIPRRLCKWGWRHWLLSREGTSCCQGDARKTFLNLGWLHCSKMESEPRCHKIKTISPKKNTWQGPTSSFVHSLEDFMSRQRFHTRIAESILNVRAGEHMHTQVIMRIIW